MFTVYLINFGYSLQDRFSTLEAAREAGKKAGFEFTVNHAGSVVGSWSPIGGWRSF